MINTSEITTLEGAREKISYLTKMNSIEEIILETNNHINKLQLKENLTHYDANLLIGLNFILKESYNIYDRENDPIDIELDIKAPGNQKTVKKDNDEMDWLTSYITKKQYDDIFLKEYTRWVQNNMGESSNEMEE